MEKNKNNDTVDGGLLTFKSTHPKFSFAKIGEDGFVKETVEKKVISDCVSTGIYYFKKGSEFVKYAEQMIEKNIRVNDEFYICPIYNENIKDDKKIKIFNCEKMICLGTPEDLDLYLNNN